LSQRKAAGFSERASAQVSDEHVDHYGVQKYLCGMSEERREDDDNEFGPRGHAESREADTQQAQNLVVNDCCDHEEHNAGDGD
jgi:hypothetical protein